MWVYTCIRPADWPTAGKKPLQTHHLWNLEKIGNAGPAFLVGQRLAAAQLRDDLGELHKVQLATTHLQVKVGFRVGGGGIGE